MNRFVACLKPRARREGGQGGKCPGARRLLGAPQGPQSTLSTYENIYIGPVTALYERACDRSAQGPGFSLGGPVKTWCRSDSQYQTYRKIDFSIKF